MPESFRGSPKHPDRLCSCRRCAFAFMNGDHLSQSSSVSARSEFRRPFPIHNRACHRDVGKFLTIHRTTQHESATAHIAAADKCRRKSQPVAESCQQDFNVLAGGDAAEKNHFALCGQFGRETPRVALDRQPVARIALVNIHLCKFAQIIETNSCSRIDQAACWRNDKHTWSSARWSRKRRGVSNFSAKIEPAQKSEYVRDGRAAFAAQSSRERKLRLLAQNHSRSFASGIRGRQKKNPVTNRPFHWRFSPLPNFAATRHSQLAF